MEEKKSAGEVLREKYEERGWDEMYEQIRVDTKEKIEPLDLTEEEYQAYARELAKKAIENQDSDKADEYFELQRRATYGNRYGQIKDLEEAEEIMWTLGTEEKIDSAGPRLR